MKRQTGFSLIELAIVLVIVTLLLGGLTVPLAAQIQARRVADTQRTLEEARDAVIGFARTHPVPGRPGFRHLPCPDVTDDGREDRSGDACASVSGLLPWVDLGTASQDAWGNRLRYAVAAGAANRGGTGGFSANTITIPDPIEICSTHTCATPDIASEVTFVVVSHGLNGWGARNVNGSTLAAPTGLDEAGNLDANRVYISRTPTQPDAPNGEYDDLLTWLSLPVLIPRVCPPAGCP